MCTRTELEDINPDFFNEILCKIVKKKKSYLESWDAIGPLMALYNVQLGYYPEGFGLVNKLEPWNGRITTGGYCSSSGRSPLEALVKTIIQFELSKGCKLETLAPPQVHQKWLVTFPALTPATPARRKMARLAQAGGALHGIRRTQAVKTAMPAAARPKAQP